MQLKPAQTPAIPGKPQVHSKRCHHTYNGARHLPLTTWVRSPTVRGIYDDDDDKCTLVYEIVLFYKHNRACIIYRSWDDFRRLKNGLPVWKNAASFRSMLDVCGLHQFLQEALLKRPREVAMEYFLRRRIGDCGGE